MWHQQIIDQLERNGELFRVMFQPHAHNTALTQYRPDPSQWSLHIVLCHLLDEEREDFRARLAHVLQTPDQPLPPVDPEGWVLGRNYAIWDYAKTLDALLQERQTTVAWLRGLPADVNWQQAHMHPRFGPLSAEFFLANWLAHDQIHIRQINRLMYQYHAQLSGQDLRYAGKW